MFCPRWCLCRVMGKRFLNTEKEPSLEYKKIRQAILGHISLVKDGGVFFCLAVRVGETLQARHVSAGTELSRRKWFGSNLFTGNDKDILISTHDDKRMFHPNYRTMCILSIIIYFLSGPV